MSRLRTTAPTRTAAAAGPAHRLAGLAERSAALARASLFQGLSDTVLAYVASHAVARQLDDGEALFYRDDADDFLALVVSGQVFAVLHGPDGQELIVDSVGAGHTLGETALLGPHRRSFSAVACGPTRLLLLQRRHFPRLMAEPTFLHRVLAMLGRRLQQSADALETLCLHRLESRLARYVLSIASAAADTSPARATVRAPARAPARSPERVLATGGTDCVKVALPPTQSILAAMVNASRPKLNAQLQTWGRDGLVSRNRNILCIKDLDRLRRKAHPDLPV